VELLLGAAIAAVVLSAAYGWLWNLASMAGRTDDRAQAATLIAAASRAIAADFHTCLGVEEPPSGRDASRAIALVHDRVDSAAETVLIVWDPGRGVLWRNASGTYLADHVTHFSVAYVLTDGSPVPGAVMSSSDWAAVRSVRVDLAVTVGSAMVRRSIMTSVARS
jgi:hypothetical protein